MAFRGYFALNGVEIANSSRVVAHVGAEVPTSDLGLMSAMLDCSLDQLPTNRLRDPFMWDEDYWATVLASPGVSFDATHREIDAVGDGSSNLFSYLHYSADTFATSPGDVWQMEMTIRADPGNPGPVAISFAAIFYDEAVANPVFVNPTPASTEIPAGQTVRVTGLVTCPASKSLAQFITGLGGTLPIGYAVSAFNPVVYRISDPPGLLGEIPVSSSELSGHSLLSTPFDGSRLYSQGLALVGDCWTSDNLCFGCRSAILYDDSWPGLTDLLDDGIYRPELAPWYSTRVPESAEFGGIWVFKVTGLDTTAVQREITEMAGSGGAPGPHRDPARRVKFEALLIACTNAGLTFGLQWLTCALRDTNDRIDSVLRYLAAHPGHSTVDPASLLREAHGVVLTQAPNVTDSINASHKQNSQATMYRVEFELTITQPYSYLPPVNLTVDWDEMTVEPIEWIHAAECTSPPNCSDMPALFAEGCDIEHIEVVNTPPPTCGGCMPVCSVTTRTFRVPTFEWPLRCRETAVSLTVRNKHADQPLTLQGYWRRCDARDECNDERWPVQINNLPVGATLYLNGITERFWVEWLGRKRRPFGMVSTPVGAPWRPPVLDRADCWEFVVISSGSASFEIDMSLADREA